MNPKDYEDLINNWIQAHVNESDDDYYEYHKKKKIDSGYIPKNNFKYDGVISPEDYDKESERILFIGKECNISEYLGASAVVEKNDEYFFPKMFLKEYDKYLEKLSAKAGKSFSCKRPSSKFIQGMAMLANAIYSGDYEKTNKDYACLKKLAFINLNKRGGYKDCVGDTLEGYTKNYSCFIRKQIKLINPTVIVCLGSGVKELMDKYIMSNADKADKLDIKVIGVYHPSYFGVKDTEKLKCLEEVMKSN